MNELVAHSIKRVEAACEPFSGKGVLLLWSGGFDSTVLAIALLKAGCKLTLLEVNSHQLVNREKESVVRDEQYRWLEKNFGKVGREKFDAPGVPANRALYSQAFWWLMVAQTYRGCNFAAIALGWVAGDETVALIDDYLHAYNAVNPLLVKTGAELVFPFAKLDKVVLRMYLEEAIQPTLGLPPVWWCEQPVVDGDTVSDCGKCPSCLGAYEKGLFRLFDRKHPYFDVRTGTLFQDEIIEEKEVLTDAE